MRKIIFLIMTLPLMAVGQVSDATMTTYVDTYIDQNAAQAITGTMLNTALNYIIDGKLHKDSIAATTGWAVSGNYIILDDNGDSVGIGTSTPGYKLGVSGDINLTGSVFMDAEEIISDITEGGTIEVDYINDFINVNRMAINYAGTPAYQLLVGGDVHTTTHYNLPNTSTADVGTLKIADVAVLHIYGTSNMFTGHGSGNFTLTDATGNAGYGVSSLASLTTGTYNSGFGLSTLNNLEDGTDNTAIGRSSMASLMVSGDYNTATGTQSMYLSTGSSNTANGYKAGYSSTGSSSVFLGAEAGYDETTGTHLYLANGQDNGTHENTWLYGNSTYDLTVPNGDLSLSHNLNIPTTSHADTGVIEQNGNSFIHTYGADNISIGISSGNFTSTGTGGNMLIGAYTGSGITTGYYNAFIGYASGQNNTEGYRNMFIGESSGRTNTTGYNNVAIGGVAFYSNLTGDENTSIGIRSGFSSTGNGSIYIGHKAGYDVASGTHLYLANNEDNGTYDATWIYGNSTYDITIPNGDLTVSGEHTSDNDFGELYDPSTVISTATANYYTLKGWTAGTMNDATFLGDSALILTEVGTYKMEFGMSHTHSANATTVHICGFKRDQAGGWYEFTNIEAENYVKTGGEVGNLARSGLFTISTAPDTVAVRGKADNTGNLTINHGNLNVIRIK